MIKKIKNCFANNLLLSAVLVVLGLIIACSIWRYTLNLATTAVPAINWMEKQVTYETDHVKNNSEDDQFEYYISCTNRYRSGTV